MQVVCDGLDLSEAAIKVSRAISNKTTNPILEGIKLVADNDCLVISATDTDLAIEKKIKAEVKVEGETVVPGKFFVEFIKKLTKERIELTLNDKNQLKIRYTDSEGSIQCYNPSEYPSFNKIDSNDFFAISQIDFKELINKTIFSVAIDDSRPILKGCLLEIEEKTINAVALDGYRLALCKKELKHSTVSSHVIVPARSLGEISKILGDNEEIINVYIQKNYIMVDLKDTKIISKTLEGEFLNYKQIIPMNFDTSIVINKSQFEDALDRASLLSKIGQNNLVKFDIKENNMQITSNSDIGNIAENVNVSFKGKDLKIAFNARYFTECSRNLQDEFVKLNFNLPTNPCVITPIEGDGFKYLILPVRMIN
ncbi:MAG: DNA polymerase III subunit beta [Firmicutes bacterium]|nr:DNA polymerase III subunit beta [Bacillota bacterium]MDY5586246.1 DNA polymerase III subunit beta [Eubacteriales bacterium]